MESTPILASRYVLQLKCMTKKCMYEMYDDQNNKIMDSEQNCVHDTTIQQRFKLIENVFHSVLRFMPPIYNEGRLLRKASGIEKINGRDAYWMAYGIDHYRQDAMVMRR